MLFFDDPNSPRNIPAEPDERPDCLEIWQPRTSGVAYFGRVLSNHGWTRETVAWRTSRTSVRPVRGLSEKHFPAWARARISSKNNPDGLGELTKTSPEKDFKRPTKAGRTPDAYSCPDGFSCVKTNDTSESGREWGWVCGSVEHGKDPDEIRRQLEIRARNRGKNDPEGYARRTVARALSFTGQV